MFRIFQILQDSFSLENLIKLYLKTGNRNKTLYDEIQRRWTQHLKMNNICTDKVELLSLENESDVTTSHYIVQVRKTSSTSKVKSYSVAIHTNLTYILFDVMKEKNKYRAYIVKTITQNLQDYQYIYQNIFPSIFMEFIVCQVSVSKAFDCELSYITDENESITLKGEKQNMCIYSNNLYAGDNGLISKYDELKQMI